MNLGVEGGPDDFTASAPWRAPGSAPVRGSGCGVAGGGPTGGRHDTGGFPPPGYNVNDDFLLIPPTPPQNRTSWARGSVQEVAWAAMANHGGGYSWRLCKNDGGGDAISEECFQRTVLRFAGNLSYIRFADQLQWSNDGAAGDPRTPWIATVPDLPFPRLTVREGTSPPGSEWARNPVPACEMCGAKAHAACNASDTAHGDYHCTQACSGFNVTACPPGMAQFPPPVAGLQVGFGGNSGFYEGGHMLGFPYSIVDHVAVPSDIEAGDYLLSWRWDCEQSPQIWQVRRCLLHAPCPCDFA